MSNLPDTWFQRAGIVRGRDEQTGFNEGYACQRKKVRQDSGDEEESLGGARG